MTPEQVVDLLSNPEFCHDVRRFIAEAAAFREHASTPEEWLQRMMELRDPFVARWGVPPPQIRELVDPDSRRQPVEAIGSGCWGIVPVFTWTTDREIRALVKTIRRRIQRQHHDARDRRSAQLVGWLEACGFDRSAIARVVYERSTGLRRPTTAQAIARTSEEREDQIRSEYLRQAEKRGIREDQIGRWVDQRVYRRLRGSEARATAAVRMAGRRYLDRIERLNERLASPIQSEPISHALTMLFGALMADGNDAAVRRRAEAVRSRLLGDPANRRRSPRSASLLTRRHEAIESEMWGIVPIFPWTTGSVIRELVKKIRAKIRSPRPESGGRPSQSAESTEFEPFCHALTRLVQALAHEDDAAVKDEADAVRVSVLRAFSP